MESNFPHERMRLSQRIKVRKGTRFHTVITLTKICRRGPLHKYRRSLIPLTNYNPNTTLALYPRRNIRVFGLCSLS